MTVEVLPHKIGWEPYLDVRQVVYQWEMVSVCFLPLWKNDKLVIESE